MSVVENFWNWVEKISTGWKLRHTKLSIWIPLAIMVVHCTLAFCEEKESLVELAKKENVRREALHTSGPVPVTSQASDTKKSLPAFKLFCSKTDLVEIAEREKLRREFVKRERKEKQIASENKEVPKKSE